MIIHTIGFNLDYTDNEHVLSLNTEYQNSRTYIMMHGTYIGQLFLSNES